MKKYKYVVSFIAKSTEFTIVNDILTRYKTHKECVDLINRYAENGWILTHVSIGKLIPIPITN